MGVGTDLVTFCLISWMLWLVTIGCSADYVPFVITDENVGRFYDGIGAISGGGATSKLLINYPDLQQSQILDYLFKPNYGASLQILKVEIGGDGQSSEGCESSHMHEEWDENYSRGYEWWMMSQAKKRNPNIKLYGLPWAFPSWISNYNTWYPFINVNKTAEYVIKWIRGAKLHYNLDIDYIGIWNEKPYDKRYIKTLRSMLNENGFSKVQIVAADMIDADSWAIATDMLNDHDLSNSVDIVGGHYIGTWSTGDAQNCGKPLWASESGGGATSTVLGAGCLARIFNQNYINGYMTSTITWNLITSYYDHIYADREGLMVANQPWSGYYEVSPPIWATAHTTQFTDIGWRYVEHGHGVNNLPAGGTIVTLASPDRKDFTIVIETMDVSSYGFCIEPPQGPYKVQPQNVTLILNGNLKKVTGFHIWETNLDLENDGNSVYFRHVGFLKNYNGLFSLDLKVNSIYTLTTLNKGFKGSVSNIPHPGEFPRIYKDNFENYPDGQEPYNIVSQTGMFEVGKSADKVKQDKVLRQVVQHEPVLWCPFPLFQPTAIIGNSSWSDVSISVDVFLSPEVKNTTSGVFLAARVDKTGCEILVAKGVFFFLMFDQQVVQISTNLIKNEILYEAPVQVFWSVWYSMSLTVKGSQVTASINDTPMFAKDMNPPTKNGFVAFGTYDFGLAEFDNLSIDASHV